MLKRNLSVSDFVRRHNGRVLFILLFVLVSDAMSDVPKSQKAEVDHLLDFVRGSNCTLIRNRRTHTSKEAHTHILRKYEHFREKIQNTEDFIDLAASKSTLSGRPYHVTCDGGQPISTRDWLLRELDRYRSDRDEKNR